MKRLYIWIINFIQDKELAIFLALNSPHTNGNTGTTTTICHS